MKFETPEEKAWGDRARVDLGWHDTQLDGNGGAGYIERSFRVVAPVAVAGIVGFWLVNLGIAL